MRESDDLSDDRPDLASLPSILLRCEPMLLLAAASPSSSRAAFASISRVFWRQLSVLLVVNAKLWSLASVE